MMIDTQNVLPHCAICRYWQGNASNDIPAECLALHHKMSRFSSCNWWSRRIQQNNDQLGIDHNDYGDKEADQ